jgi:hypothetical protein
MKQAITKLIGLKRQAFNPRENSVAMFHIGRCGSTVLSGLLKQNPAIAWDGEIFQGDTLLGKSHHRKPNAHWRWAESGYFPHSPYLYISSRMNQAPTGRVYGFETKYFHVHTSGLTLAGYVEMLKRLGVTRWIMLTRENTLRTVISALIGNQAEYYHLAGDQESSRRQIEVDVHKIAIDSQIRPLIDVLKQYEQDQNTIKKLLHDQNMLFLSYEQHIENDPQLAYDKICQLLNVQPAQSEIKHKKTNPYPVRDLILNVEDVREHLSGSGFDWMLEG